MKRSRPKTLEPISGSIFLIVFLHLVAAAGAWWWWRDGRLQAFQAEESRLAWMHPGDFKSGLPPVMAAVAPDADGKAAADAKSTASVRPKSDEPPVQKATLVAAPPEHLSLEPVPNATSTPLFAPAITAPKPSANRSITLRRVHEKPPPGSMRIRSPAPPMSSPTLLDIARLNTLRPAPPIPPPGAAAAVLEEDANLDAVDEAVNAAFLAAWIAPPLDAVPASQREARLNIAIGKDGTVLKAQMSKFSGSHVLDQSIIESASRVKKISAALPSNFAKDSYDLELNFLLLP